MSAATLPRRTSWSQFLAAALLLAAGAVAHRLERVRTKALSTSAPPWAAAAISVDQRRVDDSSALALRADSLGQSALFGEPVDPAVSTPAVVTPAPEPPAALILRGILGGPPWVAIVSGLSGRTDARVVAEGDTVGGGRVMQVRATELRIRRTDRVDTLRFRSDWRNP